MGEVCLCSALGLGEGSDEECVVRHCTDSLYNPWRVVLCLRFAYRGGSKAHQVWFSTY